jgi:glycosyltransferase involved in cell wall biosynthesis
MKSSTNMRIALVNLGRTGAGPVYALEIAKAIAPKVELFSVISSQVENITRWRETDLKILEVNTYKDFKGFLINTLRLNSILQIASALRKYKPDVIYFPMLHVWIPLISILVPNILKVFTLHDPIEHLGENNLFNGIIRKWGIRQSARIIVLSEIFKPTLVKNGYPNEHIDIIPHGEFSYYRKIARKEEPQQPHAPTILFFGRILAYKGLGTLLSAFPEIKQKIPDARLMIVGSGQLAPYRALLENQPDITVINEWIKEEDVDFYFRQANIVVLPYLEGTQSGVIPISYSYKLPVVVTRVGGLPEQVKDGETGLIVEPNDANALANACILLLKNRVLARKLGIAGCKLASTEWNWSTIGGKIIAACQAAMIQ